jgi:hypothetical protein
MSEPKWQRRYVSFVESTQSTDKFLHLNVKVPREMVNTVSRECLASGAHSMAYYADAFAAGLADALTRTDQRP